MPMIIIPLHDGIWNSMASASGKHTSHPLTTISAYLLVILNKIVNDYNSTYIQADI